MSENKNSQFNPEIIKDESKKLQEVYDVLVLRERNYKDYINEINESLSVISDPYERKELINERNYRQSEIGLINKTKNEPYFLRVDYKPVDDVYAPLETVYIGKELIEDGADRLVFNWQTQIYEAAMLQNFNEFQDSYLQHTKPHEFYLKRAINCTHNKLNGYFDRYSKKIGVITNNDGIVDPFLVSVLERKRNNPEISDIISTIQKDQFMLMIRPAFDNFVVQGCAGSGKTMILLHRVSFQLYRDTDLKSSQFWIITPNEIFLNQIRNLRNELKIDVVPTYTVLSFYQELYKLYGYNMQVNSASRFSKEAKKIFNHKNDLKNTLNSTFDLLLDEDDRESLRFLIETFDESNAFKDSKKTLEVINRWLIKISPNLMSYMDLIGEFTQLSNTLSTYQKQHQITTKLFDDEISVLRKNSKKLIGIEQNYDKFNSLLMTLFDLTQEQLHSESSLNSLGKRLLKLFFEIQSFDESSTTELILPILERLYKWIKFLQSVTKKSIKHIILPQIFTRDEIIVIQKRIRSSIEKLKEIDFNTTNIKYLEATKETLLSESIESFEQFFLHFPYFKDEVIKLYNQNEAYNLIVSKIENFKSNYPVISELIYSNKVSNLVKGNEFVNRFQEKYFNPVYISDQYFDLVLKTKFDYNFRDHLCLRLSIINYFKGSLANTVKKGVLFFDEAQDIHSVEYKLFRAILPDFSINAYGDIQQSIINEASVEDWRNIDYSIEVIEMNQNYRNSVEITEFVNKKLGMNMKSIGINESEVEVSNTADLKQIVKKLITELKRNRIAIISNASISNPVNYLNIIEFQNSISFNKVEKEKISIISVQEAKGLEFETVIVIEKGLSNKELYVAYTRALKKLIVIR